MKFLKILILILSIASYGQENLVSSIEKNINDAALGLEQKLNTTLDTLILKSDSDILRVTLLNHNEKDSEIIDVGSSEVKIPLYHLKKGRYTIAVYTDNKIIALGANRISNIPVPENAIIDIEESILRASLSSSEQIARNMKPLIRKKKTVEKNNTNLASALPKKKVNKSIKLPKRKRNKKFNTNKKLALAKTAENKKLEPIKKVPPIIKDVKVKKNKATALKKEKNKQPGTLITVKKVTYNLSNIAVKKEKKQQSREEYRKNNLRPNGKKYDN